MNQQYARVGQALFILLRADGVFEVSGRLDERTAPALRRTLETNPIVGRRRLLDLRGVVDVDAAGMAVLCENAHRLHLVTEPCSPVAAVVHAYGIDSPTGVLRAVR